MSKLKYYLGFSIIVILFVSCSEGIETHFLKGEITYALTKEIIPSVNFRIRDGDILGFCDNIREEFTSDQNGQFNFSFESRCDALIFLELSDSLKTIYNGKCYKWDVIDKNENNLNSIHPRQANDFTTERDTDYDFDIQLHPIIEMEIYWKDVLDLEFDSISIDKLGFYKGGDRAFVPKFEYKLNENNFTGEIVIEVFYSNSEMKTINISYDYFQRCSMSLTIER